MSFNTQRYVPGTYTKPLSDDFASDGPWLREFCDRYIKTFDGKPFKLEPWQADLIDAILERYPADWPVERLRGRLRYRQVVVSMGRQNGKSVIGTVLGLYGLFQHGGPTVISLASNRKQADIVFDRVKKIIDKHPQLKKRFKTTHTRGITRTDRPGKYEAMPAKADALQGIPVTLCLFDEVHICDEDMWDAMVEGTTAQPDGMVLGITTAGDDTSVLLKRLYKLGQEAVEAADSRFGFFLWEAPADCSLDDTEALMDANPAIAGGRLDLDVILQQLAGQPEDHVRRYRFNQFQKGGGSWLPMAMWHRSAFGRVPKDVGKLVFAIDRTPSWEFATITANAKGDDGTIYTQMVVEIGKPNLEWLVNLCKDLNSKHSPYKFVMDGYNLKDLGKELQNSGLPVEVFRSANDTANACTTTYALIATGKVRHNNDARLAQQMPFAVKKNVGESWRISRPDSSVSIDAVMATVYGIYAADKYQDVPMQIFG